MKQGTGKTGADPYEVKDEAIKGKLRELGGMMKNALEGTNYGFSLFLFQFDGPNMFYISTASREDVLKSLEEFIKKQRAN